MPFFMILWIIANVSVCFLPIEVLPGIFKYGYAGPFYNISQGVRAILFGTKNHLGLNFGVLLAWIVISMLTLPLFQWFMRREHIEETDGTREKAPSTDTPRKEVQGGNVPESKGH
jgi:ABC-type polysaccharide/polyol phosphate export permease